MQAPFPLFGALNVPCRIIELLHTNRHRELLSGRPEVQILLATYCEIPRILGFQSSRYFTISEIANQNSDSANFSKSCVKNIAN